MTRPDTAARSDAEERKRLSYEIQRQLGDRARYLDLAYEIAGRRPAAHDYPTLAELRDMHAAIPAYLERLAEERAARRPRRASAADKLAALEDAIRDGLDVHPSELAAAQAEAQAEAAAADLADEGRKAREKAARELTKRQKAALDAVRSAPPALPADLDERMTAAEAAIAAVLEAISEYGEQVEAAAATLRAGGVYVQQGAGFTGTDEDRQNHIGPGYVVVDGVTHSPSEQARKLRQRLSDAIAA